MVNLTTLLAPLPVAYIGERECRDCLAIWLKVAEVWWNRPFFGPRRAKDDARRFLRLRRVL